MTVVKLLKVGESDQNPAAVYDDGEYTLGRNEFFTDKRISRQHALLKISKDEVTLVVVHQNPCYYKIEGGKIVTLPKGESIKLHNEDEFSFLKEHSWLKIQISEDSSYANLNSAAGSAVSNDTTTEPSNSSENKRKHSFDASETLHKVARKEDSAVVRDTEVCIKNEADTEVETQAADPTEIIDTGPAAAAVKTELLGEGAVKQELDAGGSVGDWDSETVKDEVKDEPVALTAAAVSSTGEESAQGSGNQQKDKASGDDAGVGQQKRKWRDRCWYGKECYRKNTEHRATFRHPGDSDYDSDPNDNRPSCSYGSACYRRNPVHRQDYKHPSSGGAKPKGKRTRAKPKKAQTTLDDDEEDDYDLEDPFINDDSEDDFEPDTDDDTDSEWFDSQETGNDEEDTKQLLKEAKRITRTQKKH